MVEIHSFAAVWPGLGNKSVYSAADRTNIAEKRRELGGQLFFDRLLASLGISKDGVDLYPPKSPAELKKLHKLIVDAEVQEHWRVSVLYYLLRDWHQSKGAVVEFEKAETFAMQTFLPEKYRVCVEGLWYLDRLALKDSLNSLTNPTLLPTFPEDVLRTLLAHAPQNPDTLALPLAYYESVVPPLTNPELLDEYFEYLCSLSLSSGLSFMRAQSTIHHQRLLEMLITSALTGPSGEPRAQRGVELVELPLSSEEEGWFEGFLLEGEGMKLHAARDTVIMRRIALGRVSEAEEAGRQLSGRKIDDVSWEDVKTGLARGVGPRGEGWGSVFMVENC